MPPQFVTEPLAIFGMDASGVYRPHPGRRLLPLFTAKLNPLPSVFIGGKLSACFRPDKKSPASVMNIRGALSLTVSETAYAETISSFLRPKP